MRKLVVTILCAGLLTTAHAQNVASIITPHPVSIAITVGRWLMQDSKKLYYIEVESRAETFFQAKNEGFRLATEHALGSLVLSESHVTNGRLSRDEIITYSSGYVDNFEIVQRDDVAGGVILKMKVWVAHSAIANRLLNQSTKDGRVEGERVATQIATLNHQRQSGDRLLSTVLSDFPHRAFDIKLDKTKVVYTNQRTAQLYVGFYINWNINYLNSMAEALTAINQRTQCGPLSRQVHCQGSYQVEIARPGFSRNTRTYFDDDMTGRMFQDQVWNKRPGIILTLRDFNGNQLSKQCYPNFHMIWNYVNFGPGKNITVRGDYVKWMDTYVDLTGLPVERLDKVEITVVSGHGCN